MSVTAKELKVRLGGTPILQSVDFEANAGEVSMIIGPNGSGKTTLLRALAGDIPHSGKVVINGTDIGRMNKPGLARLRAVLAQHTALSFPFTVAEVVEMGERAGQDPAPGIEARSKRIRSALEMVDLAGFSERPCQELSGGEQQRVHLARVLSQIWQPLGGGEPRWLFLDEPVSSLDIRHQIQVMETARRYARAGGGVIAVMHDLNLAAMFGDRVVAMSEGCVVKSGTPEEVLTSEVLSDLFGCSLEVGVIPDKWPFVLPQSAAPA
ncbi:MAG: heme ABC transporter ATP-binding protein [Hyphomicrobiales bacterium]|nr:heme ABC transporter ATP-binding protein [Nitratireductor sp.]MCC2096883.1 heme ABC transporter ATP-binding protein [Hyphomicrobiales bacterium]